MKQIDLHTAAEFRGKFTWAVTKPSFYIVPLILLFLVPLVQLSSEQGVILAWTLLVLITVQTIIITGIHSGWIKPIQKYLNDTESGEISDATRHEAFRATMNIPLRLSVLGCFSYLFAGISTGVILSIFSETFTLFSAIVFISGTAASGFLAQSFTYVDARRFFTPYRERLTAEIVDTEARKERIHPFTLKKKVTVTVCGLVFSSVLFAVFMAHNMATDSIERYIVNQENEFLEVTLQSYAETDDIEATLAHARTRLIARQIELALIDIEPNAERDARIPHLLGEELRAIRENAQTPGGFNSNELRGVVNCFSWMPVPDRDQLLVAITPASAFSQHSAAVQLDFFVLIGIALIITLLIAYIATAELDRSIRRLGQRLEQIVSGDFSRGTPFEAEDEIGNLGRIAERMGSALRDTMQKTADASIRVDDTAALIAGATERIQNATEVQTGGIQIAESSMSHIRSQIELIAGSARALNESVESASSATHQLSASSDELGGNAGVFSSSVREVSIAIEGMVENIRTVDTNTIATRQLAESAIHNAQQGEDRVLQTIQAMDKIQKTTSAGRDTIHELDERAREIDSILAVIREVADQTTMLGLNAAVISDRGGIEGKAFGVVAEEMQSLSKKVVLRAKEIENRIVALQEGSADVMDSIQRSIEGVEAGVRDSQAAGKSLEKINENSRTSGGRIADIDVALSAQRKKAESVSQYTNEMRALADQIYSTAEEQSLTSRQIAESIETVGGASERIHRSLEEQAEECNHAVETLDQLVQRTQQNAVMVQNINDVIDLLTNQAEALHGEVKQFRLTEE